MKLRSTVRMWKRCEYQEGADGSTINISSLQLFFVTSLQTSFHPSIYPSFSDVKSWGAILFSYWSHGTCTSLFWHMFIFCFWKLCGFTLIFSLSPACCAVICYINDVQTTEWLWLTRKVSDFINALSGYVYITSPMIYVEMSFDVVQINKTGSPGFV